MRIGEVAARTGVSPATCRYYERYGLLPRPARRAGKRDYDPAAVARLALILFAKEAGLSLSEIRELLRPGPTHERWREARRRKLEMLRDLERLLRKQRRLLHATTECVCTTPEECGRATSALLDRIPRYQGTGL
ncbi:MAG: MerR family transcriptional regulator [Luteitalea sp.]|nr:MerR family transcriptional regulator [Luteitalea sp.]